MTEPDADRLETGHDPQTPPGDNLLRDFTIAFAAEIVETAARLAGAVTSDDGYVAAEMGRVAGFMNSALLLEPLHDAADPRLGALDRFYARRAGHSGTVYLWSPWPTVDLDGVGWTLAGHPPLMVRLPDGRDLPQPPAGLRVEEVADATGVRVFEETVAEAFPMEGRDYLDGRVLDPALRVFVGWEGDRAVATSTTSLHRGLNLVNYVSAREDVRGRGYGEAMTWRATLVEPDRPAALLASDAGRPIYERMGYVSLCRFTLWMRARD